jgi:peptide/nickel transport system permease protein
VLSYILRRLLWMVPTLLGITLLLFVVLRLAPGDPALLHVAGDGQQARSAEGGDVEAAITKFRRRYRLDEPLHVQYGAWLGSLATLDFGQEFARPSVAVRDELWQRLQVTVPLSAVAVLLSYLIALPLGIWSAVRPRSPSDRVATLLVFLLYSLPTFWAGLMLILLFGQTGLGWLPILGLHDQDAAQLSGWAWWQDLLLHSILPVATLTYGGLAYLSRQMRAGLLETVRQDYVRTARAKGLPERLVVLRHALRNALIPVVTIFATILPVLIGGSVLVESIFNIPGMGLYAYEGVLRRDYNVVMATTTVSAVLTLLGFLLSDILYAVVDPRISHD